MLFATVLLAAENTHSVTVSRMKRVEDLHLKTQTPGIMTLARPASAKAGSHARSATRPAGTIAACCINGCRGSSMRSH
jgi:hypothetical protein